MAERAAQYAAGGPASAQDAARRRGALLRAWRTDGDAPALGLRELARAVGVPWQTWQGWESGRRGRDVVRAGDVREAVRRAGRLLAAPDALPALWAAVGTADVLPARSDWATAFSPAGGPCWIWVRAAGAAVTADLHWGVALHGRAGVPVGGGGLLVQFPACVANPPLEVALTGPGWVDAGLGRVPPAVAQAVGATLVAAADLQRGGPRHGPPALPGALAAVASESGVLARLARDLGLSWELIAPHLGEVLLPAPPHALDPADLAADAAPGPPVRDRHGVVVRQLLLAPGQVKVLREARGFRQEEAASAASTAEMRSAPTPYGERVAALSRSSLQRLETSGALPRAGHVLARLDRLYGADGRLGIERVFDSAAVRPPPVEQAGRTRHCVRFPDWWLGPVWLQPSSPDGRGATAVVQTTWGPWTRRTRVASGMVLTTRHAPYDRRVAPEDRTLVVELPTGWRLVAGTGAVPTALDIGRAWRPTSVRALREVLRETLDTIRGVRPGGAAGRG